MFHTAYAAAQNLLMHLFLLDMLIDIDQSRLFPIFSRKPLYCIMRAYTIETFWRFICMDGVIMLINWWGLHLKKTDTGDCYQKI